MRKILILLLTLFASANALWAASESKAVITYLEGAVDISREGEYLDFADIDIGTEISDYDLIETGSDGYVELEMTTASSPGVQIKISEDTEFYFDSTRKGDKKKTGLQVLTGSLTLKVQKLYKDGELDVKVNNTVMGVRGTEFTVSSALDGSTLVTTKEGKVACSDPEGRTLYSVPGTAVENENRGPFKETKLSPREAQAYIKKWKQRRMEVFFSNLEVSAYHYMNTYSRLLPDFEEAYKALYRMSATFRRWQNYMIKDQEPSLGQAVKDKQSVSRQMVSLRAVYPLFLDNFAVLSRIAPRYLAGVKAGTIKKDPKVDRFIRSFKKNRRENRIRLSRSLYFQKLFLEMGKRISGDDADTESLLDSMGSGPSLMGPPKPMKSF